MLTRIHPALGLLGIGWYFALSIVLGTIGGLLVDDWLETKPIFTMAGLFSGLALACWGGYKLLVQVMSNTNRDQGVHRD